MQYKRIKLFVFTLMLGLYPALALAHGMSDFEKEIISKGGNLGYMWIGATHMLTGYDHLMFVFGIIFLLTNFRDIVKYVTAFTLGHSITLIYATYSGIQLNYFLIDAVVALSVCYIAFANLDGFRKYLGIEPPNMLFMIVGLGLVHGFGLSTRLQEMVTGSEGLLLKIISFNVGIEVGQISALALMLVFVALWRTSKSFELYSKVANHALIAAGLLLFLSQMHGYSHSSVEGEAGSTPAVSYQEASSEKEWMDTATVTVPAKKSIEYKVNMKKDEVLEYSWKSNDGEIYYELHAEPKGDTSGYYKSFKKGRALESEGAITAEFEGTHGWVWANISEAPVEVFLNIRGTYELIEKQNEP